MNRAEQSLPPDSVIFGQTAEMSRLHEEIDQAAKLRIPILIEGESGTGKEIVALYLIARSERSDRCVKINCPAIPATLLESELFGYEKGAFTGAHCAKRGRVELADRGTLFLDEIGELEIGVQAKLIQLLQDGTYCRVGGQEERKVDVRIISATNRDLQQHVAQGLFRSDLYYRINAFKIHLPPLRDRIVDLPLLADYFLHYYATMFDHEYVPFSPETLRIMQHYHWPGNVRQLENLVRRFVMLQDEQAILAEILEEPTDNCFVAKIEIDTRLSLKQATKRAIGDLERQVIRHTLQLNGWNRKKTAKALAISYRGLLYKMRDAGFPRISTTKSQPTLIAKS